jgi:hypothetical protein
MISWISFMSTAFCGSVEAGVTLGGCNTGSFIQFWYHARLALAKTMILLKIYAF